MQRHTLKTAGLLSLQACEWTNTETVTFVFFSFLLCVTQHFHFHQCFFCPPVCSLTSCPVPFMHSTKGERCVSLCSFGFKIWVLSLYVCRCVFAPPCRATITSLIDLNGKNEHSLLVLLRDQQSEQLDWTRLFQCEAYLFICLFASLFWMVKRGAATVSQNTGGGENSGLQALLDRGEALSMKVIGGAHTS